MNQPNVFAYKCRDVTPGYVEDDATIMRSIAPVHAARDYAQLLLDEGDLEIGQQCTIEVTDEAGKVLHFYAAPEVEIRMSLMVTA